MSEKTRPIRIVGDPVLSTPCAPVTEFDDDLSELIDEMFRSMYAARGVGLAANQIGVGLRVFVYDCPDEDDRSHVGHLVNPVLEPPPADGRVLDESDEGCLSVPGRWAPVARPDQVVARGVDKTGAPVTVEGTGLLARCLQHETDHLDGYLYLDRLSARLRRKILREMERDRADDEIEATG